MENVQRGLQIKEVPMLETLIYGVFLTAVVLGGLIMSALVLFIILCLFVLVFVLCLGAFVIPVTFLALVALTLWQFWVGGEIDSTKAQTELRKAEEKAADAQRKLHAVAGLNAGPAPAAATP